MQVTDEILLAFLNCSYKGYLKSNGQKGINTEYQILFDQLKKTQKDIFTKSVIEQNNYGGECKTLEEITSKNIIYTNLKFENDKIKISLDAVEFIQNKEIIPTLISPLEKVTKAEKLYLAIKAMLIQNEFNLQSESCKIIFGKNQKLTRFKLSALSKIVKKSLAEINKILSDPIAPVCYKNAHCQVCEFNNSCLEKLRERDDLSLLAGMKAKEIQQKNNRGIFSVKQLSYTFHPNKNQYRKRKFLPELKALAIRDNKTFIHDIPDFKNNQVEIYLDIEGIPDRNQYYLIGVVIINEETEKEHSFWADSPQDELPIFIELINLLKTFDDYIIYHYGSYEIQALKLISKKLPVSYEPFIINIIERCVNMLNVFTNSIYPPTYSNGLKEIAQFLGFDWSEKNACGMQSIMWRYHWELTKNDGYKFKLLKYNIEDCKALIIVKDWINNIGKENDGIKLVSSVKKENIFKWGITNYAIKDFEEINAKAYFNYQREHIFLRTEKKVHRAIKREKKLSAIYNNIDAEVNLFPLKCPYCRGENIIKLHISKKKQVDLVFMKQGIKKKTTLFTGGPSICDDCKKKLPATDMLRFPKYGHNLMIWSVNQKIQYCLSSENIANLLRDSFKIITSTTQMTRFKELIAKKYIPAYKEIMVEISKSTLIHIDETIARIKDVDGYVWVFANYENVYYQFRETRETDFLIEILSGFNGILVSDFYTGYDSLGCRQQKCLVHLIRDLNEDFLKHQLDEQLKIIVIEFGNLLRSIIATVDKYGLKQTHLKRHKKDVDRFYSNVILKDFESDFALSYKKRFIKYRIKLFEFLDSDSVPWNNNNAEYSIKPFAKWRKENSKKLTKSNIENHLVLLSILQTCKYRGINFFEFLKSGETSISIFGNRKQA